MPGGPRAGARASTTLALSPCPRSPTAADRRARAALLPILLVAGLWLGGHPEDLPGFVRSAFVANHQTQVGRRSDRSGSPTTTTGRSPPASSSNASIAGVVASLDDRFSHYLTPSEFREFNAPPHFTGIGVAVGPGTPRPADRARVQLLAGRPRRTAGRRSDRGGQRAQARRPLRRRGHRADQGPARHRRRSSQSKPRAAARTGHGGIRTVKITRAIDLRAGRGLRDQDRPRRQARRGRARELQPGRARGSARSGRTRAARGRPRDRARPARQRRRPGRGGAADREHLHPQGHDRDHPRAHPADRDARGDRRRDLHVDPDGRARRLATPPPPRRSSRRRCRTTTARRSSARTRSARASSRRSSRSPTAARSTSPSASTSRPTGATSAAAASSRAPASSPKCSCPMASTPPTAWTWR